MRSRAATLLNLLISSHAARSETKFNIGTCKSCVLCHHVPSLLHFIDVVLFADYRRSYLAHKVSITSKTKFSRSLHRRNLAPRAARSAESSAAGGQPARQCAGISNAVARLMMWLPPNVSIQAIVAAIRRLLLGGGWQYANTCAVLLLKLRPLLFCALYAAGQRWAAWASCIACDIAAIKLVRLVNAAVKDDLLLTHLTDSAYSAAHAHGMVDSNAMAAVQSSGGKLQLYLLRNPFYNATVRVSLPSTS